MAVGYLFLVSEGCTVFKNVVIFEVNDFRLRVVLGELVEFILM
jgi:hypothetical protein